MWHGGQHSALYSFASSGIYDPQRSEDYTREIKENAPTTERERQECSALIEYFEHQAKKKNPKPYTLIFYKKPEGSYYFAVICGTKRPVTLTQPKYTYYLWDIVSIEGHTTAAYGYIKTCKRITREELRNDTHPNAVSFFRSVRDIYPESETQEAKRLF